MFKKILIANRGEIARRIQRSCRSLGIATVAVYSEADVDALHVREADEAVLIGPPPVQQSYLQKDVLVSVALERGCDAVHPGYGLLSENADFARAVAKAGLCFVGPSPDAIATMGSKLESRRLAALCDVPVLPASGPVDPEDDDALDAAGQAVGFPLLVKLSAGGGGIGMTRVELPKKLKKAVAKAARRGQSAFGDPTVYLERAVDKPRHVEVQVLADHHGKVLHFFERDCSVQRRHQKVIEEAPAPGLGQELRDRITGYAVRLAQEIDYQNAGTVEFLVDGDEAWLLEMNTRIQVEHPVTEAITGVDLVEWQLRIAAGEELPFAQSDLETRGHAVELRLYAEDPIQFMPAPGTIETCELPDGPGIRIDHALEAGQEVSPFYDPMLAKLVVHAEDRAQAIEHARAALDRLCLTGITHNAELHREVLQSEQFASGRVHTGLIAEIRSDTC
ncbi:MAG TPA: biotin carboxylase [Deltaproteobacteria bacterium]|nr:biotin carboxylase [Deltaproteobacteria bacterium]